MVFDISVMSKSDGLMDPNLTRDLPIAIPRLNNGHLQLCSPGPVKASCDCQWPNGEGMDIDDIIR